MQGRDIIYRRLIYYSYDALDTYDTSQGNKKTVLAPRSLQAKLNENDQNDSLSRVVARTQGMHTQLVLSGEMKHFFVHSSHLLIFLYPVCNC